MHKKEKRMTVYSRSDIAAISISQAHGGCGVSHSRPVVQGAPAKLWALTCVQCEDFLRNDPLWSSTVSEIPETHDELAEREDYEKRGANDIQTMMALALTRMTGGEVPETVMRMIDGSKLHIPSAVKVLCPPYGHANPPGMKFCGECAAPMHEAVPADETGEGQDLADLHPQTLRKMCRARDLDDSGTRPEMVARLQEAGQVAA
jgi:SAP domain